MDHLTQRVIDFASLEGACRVGIATAETLAGGPPSADITYVLPEATSAVCFAFALDPARIPPFLAKKDRRSHEKDTIRANTMASGTSIDLARYLDQMGHPSYALTANNVYRRDSKHKEKVTLGGTEHTYLKRRSYLRCEFVCGGFTGLHPSGRWSTWSPGRLEIPESDGEFFKALAKGVEVYNHRPSVEGGFDHPLSKKKLNLTCGNCQLICVPDKEERRRRHKMLTESGCVVQKPDGSLEAVSPEEAARRVESMPVETRTLYE